MVYKALLKKPIIGLLIWFWRNQNCLQQIIRLTRIINCKSKLSGREGGHKQFKRFSTKLYH